MTNIRQFEPKRKKAVADAAAMQRIFTQPADEHSTLSKIEQEISRNIQGFLNQHIVASDQLPLALEAEFSSTELNEEPVFVSEQADFLLSNIVPHSVHTSSPSFIGHMTSASPPFLLAIAKIMTALNQNLVKIETSKAFTPLERQVLGILHRLIYNRDDEFYSQHVQSRYATLGSFCTGGTTANITALWVARNRLLGPRDDFPGVAEVGLAQALRHHEFEDCAVLVSDRGHYSLCKAADVLGLGRRQLLSVPTDSRNKIDIAKLAATLKELKAKKTAIIAIIGIAGTTETGSVDDLDQLADLASEYGSHFHVDAAWGGPTLMSKRHAPLLKGIERADSVTIDAHKQLYVPVGAGMVLFRDPDAADSIAQSANYIIRTGSRDLGKRTLEGSRHGMALLVHSALRVIGRRGYELLIDQGIARAREFAKMIEDSEDFELITSPELNLLTYRYIPEKIKALLSQADSALRLQINRSLNLLTIAVQKEQRSAGKTFVSRTKLQPHQYDKQTIDVFRVVLANPLTNTEVLQDILAEQRVIGDRLYRTIDNDF